VPFSVPANKAVNKNHKTECSECSKRIDTNISQLTTASRDKALMDFIADRVQSTAEKGRERRFVKGEKLQKSQQKKQRKKSVYREMGGLSNKKLQRFNGTFLFFWRLLLEFGEDLYENFMNERSAGFRGLHSGLGGKIKD